MMIHSFDERSSARFGAVCPGRGRSFILKAVLIAFVLLLLPLPRMAAYAAEGTCGDDCTWTLNDEGLLTISGTGPMNDWDWNTVPWYDHRGEIKKVVIEDGITTIGKEAFYGCGSLEIISIPESVGSIGVFAFASCTGLSVIIIPDSVGSIGDYAFYGSGLTAVIIPDSVGSIGDYAFAECTGLSEIIIPDSVGSIGYRTFHNCDSLTNVSIGNSVTSIGESAFYDCKALTSVTIPASVTSIGDYAFEDCASLTHLIIERGAGNLTIGNRAFDHIGTTKAELRCPDGYTASYSITPETYGVRIDGNTLKWDDPIFPYSFTLRTDLTANSYPLTISTEGNGSVKASVNGVTVNSGDEVKYKDTVTLTVVPESGYVADSLSVEKGEETVAVENNSFIMPAGNVTVTASFKEHEHEYSYSADGAELTAVCANTDRGHVGDSTVVLTLSGPEDLSYDGEAKEVTLDGEIPGVETPKIAYKKDGKALEQPPMDAGTYTAEITLGDATASLEFTIAPKPLSEVTVALDPAGPFPYDGEEHSVTVTASDGDKVLTESVDYEIAEGSVLRAVDTGTYEVIVEGVPVTESEEPTAKALAEGNYSGTVTLTWQITDGEQQPEPEPRPEPEPEPRRRLFRFCEDCELPATGFSSARPTALSEQPAALRYEPVRMRLMLPTLDRDVELVTVPRQGNSWAAGWLGENAGILEGTAFPGEGTAVIAAHNTLNDTQYGPFAMLASMEAGDRIFVAADDGSLLSFEVYANELLAPDDLAAIESLAKENALVLVTCENEAVDGGYVNRRAVFAK